MSFSLHAAALPLLDPRCFLIRIHVQNLLKDRKGLAAKTEGPSMKIKKVALKASSLFLP